MEPATGLHDHINISILQTIDSGIPFVWAFNTRTHDSITYHTILYYTILYYTILYYTILYYTILYYTILYYTILYYTIYCTILYCLFMPPGACCQQRLWQAFLGPQLRRDREVKQEPGQEEADDTLGWYSMV